MSEYPMTLEVKGTDAQAEELATYLNAATKRLSAEKLIKLFKKIHAMSDEKAEGKISTALTFL